MTATVSSEALGEAAVRRRRRRVMALLAVMAVVAAAAFLTVGVTGSWEYALQARSRRLAGMVVVGVAVAVSTVLFQTVTTNRIITPSVMGFDSLFGLIQTAGVFFLGASTLVGTDPRLRFATSSCSSASCWGRSSPASPCWSPG